MGGSALMLAGLAFVGMRQRMLFHGILPAISNIAVIKTYTEGAEPLTPLKRLMRPSSNSRRSETCKIWIILAGIAAACADL